MFLALLWALADGFIFNVNVFIADILYFQETATLMWHYSPMTTTPAID
jgi:hypothetical protein